MQLVYNDIRLLSWPYGNGVSGSKIRKIVFSFLLNLYLFQNGSPYIDDANELIELARQSGLIDAEFRKFIPYASKCLTHADVQKSHIGDGVKVVLKLENIYGLIILLALGLGGSVISMIIEITNHKLGYSCKGGNVGKVVWVETIE